MCCVDAFLQGSTSGLPNWVVVGYVAGTRPTYTAASESVIIPTVSSPGTSLPVEVPAMRTGCGQGGRVRTHAIEYEYESREQAREAVYDMLAQGPVSEKFGLGWEEFDCWVPDNYLVRGCEGSRGWGGSCGAVSATMSPSYLLPRRIATCTTPKKPHGKTCSWPSWSALKFKTRIGSRSWP